jgi:catechol 2,3-dioxygenase-like lactoylglutathione lyase family enzyme
MSASIYQLRPMIHVADVERSIEFYTTLGFELRRSLGGADGRLFWALLASEQAELMLTLADGPVVADQQAVIFYYYSRNVAAYREELLKKGIAVSEIFHPPHMRAGEIRFADSDGYSIIVGQLS